jgi:DNA-binding GntR family transcriptional regulator
MPMKASIKRVAPATGRSIRRLPLHEATVVALREMVRNSELLPGTKINEAMLCETFGISRTPLREALKVVASEGLIELRPHRGARVTPIDPAEVAALFQVMEALERLAGELACRNATTADLAALEEMHAQLAALHDAGARSAYFQLNRTIHHRIVTLAGNPVLTATYAGCATKAVRARSLANYDAQRWHESVEEHEGFMRAVRARDPVLAGNLWAEHSRRTGEAVSLALHNLAADTVDDPLGLAHRAI